MTDPNRYAQLGPIGRALVDDHDQIALAELLVKAQDDLERARQELQQHAEAESADAAAGSYAGRAERLEAQCEQLADIVRDLFDGSPCGSFDHHGYCQHHSWLSNKRCPHARAREVLAALDEPAIADPARWLHVVFTSPDETTANTSALAFRDHLAAEFDGVRMRITTNAVEVEPDPFSYEERERTGRNAGLDIPAATEATDIETTARVFAALHRSAEDTVTRVTNLYEQWVKAGPPPLGTSMSRWWDRRLVELHDAIRDPAIVRAFANNDITWD